MHQEKDNGCGVADFFSSSSCVCLSDNNKKKTRSFFLDRNYRRYSFGLRAMIIEEKCSSATLLWSSSLSSYDHDRKKSFSVIFSFSLLLILSSSFFILLAHIGNITKETEGKKKEKKCESVVDKQGKSMESTRKKDSVDCA